MSQARVKRTGGQIPALKKSARPAPHWNLRPFYLWEDSSKGWLFSCVLPFFLPKAWTAAQFSTTAHLEGRLRPSFFVATGLRHRSKKAAIHKSYSPKPPTFRHHAVAAVASGKADMSRISRRRLFTRVILITALRFARPTATANPWGTVCQAKRVSPGSAKPGLTEVNYSNVFVHLDYRTHAASRPFWQSPRKARPQDFGPGASLMPGLRQP